MNQHNPQPYRGVVVSLSGGPDSTALFHVFCELARSLKNFQLRAFHVHYELRGQESEDDFRFVSKLCMQHGVELLAVRHPLCTKSGSAPLSGLQQQARNVRRKYYLKFFDERLLSALGHHADDLAETVIQRLGRGTGPGALAGFAECAPPLWRPFVRVTRSEITQWLDSRGFDYRTDSSNLKRSYFRNRLRLDVMPVLEGEYPQASRRIVECAMDASDVTAFARDALRRDMNQLREAAAYPNWSSGIARLALATLIESETGTFRQLTREFLDKALSMIAALGEGCPGWTLEIPGGGNLIGKSGKIMVIPHRPAPKLARRNQHQSALGIPAPEFHLGPGSHAFIRISGQDFGIDQDHLP